MLIIASSLEEGYWAHKLLVSNIPAYKILGRPIRLADVLLAIQKIDQVQDSHLAVNAWGIFYAFSGEWKDAVTAKVEYLNLGWNLRADTLDEQSDECLIFLARLLE